VIPSEHGGKRAPLPEPVAPRRKPKVASIDRRNALHRGMDESDFRSTQVGIAFRDYITFFDRTTEFYDVGKRGFQAVSMETYPGTEVLPNLFKTAVDQQYSNPVSFDVLRGN
jgi:hypothetical protein